MGQVHPRGESPIANKGFLSRRLANDEGPVTKLET